MIAVIGAMQVEVDAIKQKMDSIQEEQIHGLSITKGSINDTDIVLALSGVGKVNAAMTVSILCCEFDITMIINIGTAGGMRKDQHTLDIVVADEIIQYDFDTSPIDGDSGLGIYAHCDNALTQLASICLKSDEYRVWRGDIASGDKFVAKDELIDSIINQYPSVMACDMESGSIAQVANHLNVKCVAIRSLSDIAHHEKSEMDFATYAAKASERSAEFVEAFIKTL